MTIFCKKNSKAVYAKGFTLIEILAVVAIVAIMASVVMYNLSAKRNDQVVNAAEDEVVSLLNQARSSTISAEQNMQYGVHFQTNRVILFQGTTFTDGASGNKEITIDPNVNIVSISLTGSSSDVVFDKLTGGTAEYGTLVVKNVSSLKQKTITITKFGFVSGN